MAVVGLEIGDKIAEIRIDRPTGNRIDHQISTELLAALDRVLSSDAHVVLLYGAGEHFCQGGDIAQWLDRSNTQIRAGIDKFAQVIDQLDRFPLPTLAVVQGECLSEGFHLALGCDLIIAGRGAQFAFPEGRLGLATTYGGIAQLADRMGKARAVELTLLGSAVDAEEMERLNVVSRVVDDENLEQEARALAARLAGGSTRAFSVSKSLLRAWSIGGVPAARAVAPDLVTPLLASTDVQSALRNALGAQDAAFTPERPVPETAEGG